MKTWPHILRTMSSGYLISAAQLRRMDQTPAKMRVHARAVAEEVVANLEELLKMADDEINRLLPYQNL